MRKELAMLIGEDNILGMEKRTVPMVQLCGMPTGSVNAYEITEKGEFMLEHGFPGRQGFNPCSTVAALNADVNVGQLIGMLTKGNPTTIKELVGRLLRVYKTGDSLTLDWRPERVNIEMNDNGIIAQIWFG
jgi:hypothetical protein